MRIVVNCIFIENERDEYYKIFILQLFKKIVLEKSKDEFVFLLKEQEKKYYPTAPNTSLQIIKPIGKTKLALKYFYDIRLNVLFRKLKPDIIIQADGYCSNGSSIAQFAVINNTVNQTLEKARLIAVFSKSIQKNIAKDYEAITNKIKIHKIAVHEIFEPLSYDEKEKCKTNITNGVSYFLLQNNTKSIEILKAFSLFKNWQQSNMKLVITCISKKNQIELEDKLITYKYRNDVIIFTPVSIEEYSSILAAAYLYIYPENNSINLQILEAMQCGIPLLTNECDIVFKESLTTNFENTKEIAQLMIRLYKDETLHQTCSTKGIETALLYSLESSSNAMWQSIANCITKNDAPNDTF